MSGSPWLRWLVVLLLVPVTHGWVWAQGRADVALVARTTTGATTFRMGERIPLVLVYSADPTAGLGIMNAANRQRRFGYEAFEVEPKAGWSDPLEAYLTAMTCCGGATAGFDPFTKPETVNLDLNAWVRFDQPGEYRVRVSGKRVLDTSLPGPEQPVVRSNTLVLRIVPATKAWQAATLAGAAATLRPSAGQYATLSLEQETAVATIRYLGSRESLAVLAAGLGEETPQRNEAFAYGLIGAPPGLQDAVLQAVRREVEDPGTGVSDWMMRVLSALLMRPAGTGEARMEDVAAAREAALEVSLAALPRKEPKARAATANVLLGWLPGDAAKEQRARVAQALSASLPLLPEDKQENLLASQWDFVRGGVSTEELRGAAMLPVNDPSDRSMPVDARHGLKVAALRRWYEREPDAAKQAAYAGIGRARPELAAEGLWFLPAEPLPAFEAVWAAALGDRNSEANPEVLAGLMTRFGTGAFASQVAAQVGAALGAQACAPQGAMLAYVVKFNAELARPLLRQATAARGRTGCYRAVFGEVSRYATAAVLTDAAMEAVGSDDPDVAADAARYLVEYGDERARGPVLTRYRAWAGEWAGRADELEPPNPLQERTNWLQGALGEALAAALLSSQGWLAEKTLQAEVVRGCAGKEMCGYVLGLVDQDRSPYAVSWGRLNGELDVHVGAYEAPNLRSLKTKLAQFPRETMFQAVSAPRSSDDALDAAEVSRIFHEAGRELLPVPGETAAP